MSLLEEAIDVLGLFPRNKKSPMQLRVLYEKARGEEKFKIGYMVEALYAASESEEDIKLIQDAWVKDEED